MGGAELFVSGMNGKLGSGDGWWGLLLDETLLGRVAEKVRPRKADGAERWAC